MQDNQSRSNPTSSQSDDADEIQTPTVSANLQFGKEGQRPPHLAQGEMYFEEVADKEQLAVEGNISPIRDLKHV
jgi:hypothetical protein